MHINGWNTIEKLLLLKGKNQSWLARKLDLSPAAITQIKNGQFSIRPQYINQICTLLDAKESDRMDLYTEIANARLCSFLPKNVKISLTKNN